MEARAILRNHPVSPRKVRRVANLIRGLSINRALTLLKFQKSPNAAQIEKVLLSAVANWQMKYADAKVPESELYVSEVRVDGAPMIKRYRPVPHGRAHRIRKRANHLKLYVRAPQEAIKAAEAALAEAEKTASTQEITQTKKTTRSASTKKVKSTTQKSKKES